MTPFLELLPPRERELVFLARDIANSQGLRVFLVGGPLRDLLLGKQLVDIDFSLERGTKDFARDFARQTHGELRAYPQFLTYKVVLPDLEPIDIATTRKEAYPRPGALPVVSPSSLRDDMLRRDFTINAMAFDLASEQIQDFFGGESDLAKGRVRVLHDASFRDDPTRIYRGLRIAVRLNFEIERHSLDLLKEAIERRYAESVSPERLWREVFLALEEQDRARVIHEFAQSGALQIPLGVRPGDSTLLPRLERADQILRHHDCDSAVVFLALLQASSANENFRGSGLSHRQIETLREIQRDLDAFLGHIRNASETDQIAVSREASDELLVVAAATDPAVRPAIERYWEYAGFAIPVRGDELGVPPGPHIGRALERTRIALFFGEIPIEEALAFARRTALEYLGKKT